MEIRVTKKTVFRRLQSFLQAKGQRLRNASRGKQRSEGFAIIIWSAPRALSTKTLILRS
jgi:hypothetical protein